MSTRRVLFKAEFRSQTHNSFYCTKHLCKRAYHVHVRRLVRAPYLSCDVLRVFLVLVHAPDTRAQADMFPRTTASDPPQSLAISAHDIPVPAPTIQNIVATIKMGQLTCGLDRVVEAFPLADYNSTRFAAAIIKLRSPAVTCSVFASGKAVITGAKGEIYARQAATQLVILLRRTGLDVEYAHFRIENIVSAAYCPFYIDLIALHERLDGASTYNPTVFPGNFPEPPSVPWCRRLLLRGASVPKISAAA